MKPTDAIAGLFAPPKVTLEQIRAVLSTLVPHHVTPETFGAAGDGETDDTIAIATALAEGVPVLFGPKTYVAAEVVLPPHTVATGGGTVLKQLPTSGDFISLASNTTERVTFEGFEIDGNKAAQSTANKGLVIDNTGSDVAHVAASTINSNDPRHSIRDVLIRDTKGDGLHVTGRGASLINDLRTYRCDGHGIYNNSLDNTWSNIDIGASGLHGLFNDSSAYNHKFSNLKSWVSGLVDDENFGDGVHHKGWYCSYSSAEVQGNKRHGFHLYQASNNVINAVVQVQSAAGWSAQRYGVVLYDSRKNVINGAIRDRDSSPVMPYGLRLNAGGSGNSGNSITLGITNAQTADTLFETVGEKASNNVIVNGARIV